MNNNIQVDAMTGMPVEYTVSPPQPSSLVSPFGDKALATGNAIMGDVNQRQMSLGNNTPLFKKSCGRYKK